MPETEKALQITALTTKEVDFNDRVQAVDKALKDRRNANKNIKLHWAKIIAVLGRADTPKIPTRKPSIEVIVDYQNTAVIYKPLDDIVNDPELKEVWRVSGYEFRQMMNNSRLLEALEKKFSGLRDFLLKVQKYGEVVQAERETDEEATAKMRAELKTAIDEYLKALEAYDDTVETVANAKEYIGVVKDIADIAAIAQGQANLDRKA